MRPPPKEAEYEPLLKRPVMYFRAASMRPPPKEAEYLADRSSVSGRIAASMRPPPKEAEYELRDNLTFLLV